MSVNNSDEPRLIIGELYCYTGATTTFPFVSINDSFYESIGYLNPENFEIFWCYEAAGDPFMYLGRKTFVVSYDPKGLRLNEYEYLQFLWRGQIVYLDCKGFVFDLDRNRMVRLDSL